MSRTSAIVSLGMARQDRMISTSRGGFVSIRIKGDANPWADIGARAKDLKPFFKSVGKDYFDNPDIYTRPDRFRGDVAEEKNGWKINWKNRYGGTRNRRVSLLKKSIRISSSVPYHPEFSAPTIDDLTERMTRYILGGL
jgi:hypothetical protein